MTPKVIEAVAEEPLTLEECRLHLRVDPLELDSNGEGTHPDDALIMALQGAAREHCEAFLGLSLAPRVLEIALDSFPADSIDLPMGPVREILIVTVPPPEGDSDSDATSEDEDPDVFIDGEVNPAVYVLDDYSVPARVSAVSSWPSVTTAANAVKVRYLAGYGIDSDGGEPLPKAIRAAILLMLGHLYENREAVNLNTLLELPLGVEALLRPLRIRLGMA